MLSLFLTGSGSRDASSNVSVTKTQLPVLLLGEVVAAPESLEVFKASLQQPGIVDGVPPHGMR